VIALFGIKHLLVDVRYTDSITEDVATDKNILLYGWSPAHHNGASHGTDLQRAGLARHRGFYTRDQSFTEVNKHNWKKLPSKSCMYVSPSNQSVAGPVPFTDKA
jgi:hypothetical protein